MNRIKHFCALCSFAVLAGGIYAQGPSGVSLFQSTGARSSDLQLNPAAVNLLQKDTGNVSLNNVPLVNGVTANFNLSPFSVFSDDAHITVMRDNGATESLAMPEINTWYGTDPTNPSRALFLAANDSGRVRVMVTGDETTSVTVIQPKTVALGSSYRIVPANLPKQFFCHADELQPQGIVTRDATITPRVTNTVYQLDVMMDVGNSLYQKLDSNSDRVLAYVVDLFGSVNAIYRRDLKLILSLSSLTIWDTADPFGGDTDSSGGLDSSDQLTAYQTYVLANRPGNSYDIAHLLENQKSFGGIAYVNVIGNLNSSRFGVSNVYADDEFPDDPLFINQFYWDTIVMSHEIGHNLGSPHTHCYNPPIDCCYIPPADKEPGCQFCLSVTPTVGTIMSYCHTVAGGSVILKFHEDVIAFVRPFIESSSLVSPFVDAPTIQVSGLDNRFVTPGGVTGNSVNGTAFPGCPLPGSPISETFTIKNAGALPLTLTGSPAVTVTGSSSFAITAQPASNTLAPGAAVTFTVQLTPTTAGSISATVNIPSNDPNRPTYSFAIDSRVALAQAPVTAIFTGSAAIPDNDPVGVNVPITFSGVTGSILNMKLKFDGSNCGSDFTVGIHHEYVGDLAMTLTAPTGQSVSIMNRPGAGYYGSYGRNFCGTVIGENPASLNINMLDKNAYPYTGTYRASEGFRKFRGLNANGTWILNVRDMQPDPPPAPIQAVQAVSIEITPEQPPARADDWSLYM